MKFKLKGRTIGELPEIEIEAKDKEEAEEKYHKMFNEGKIEEDCFSIEFDEEEDILSTTKEDDISDEGWDGMPRIVRGKDGKEYAQDIMRAVPLKKCKIYGLKEEDYPNEVWDSVDYALYYSNKGYEPERSGEVGTENQCNYLYKRKKEYKIIHMGEMKQRKLEVL